MQLRICQFVVATILAVPGWQQSRTLAVGVTPRMDGKTELTRAQQARVIEILPPMLPSPQAELAKNSPSYFWRSRVSRANWGTNLREWNEAHGGADILALLRAKMAAVCPRQGGEADGCKHWSYPPNQP